MRPTFDRMAVGVLAVSFMLGAFGQTATAGQKTLTGIVTDAMCGRTHMLKDKSDAECLRACVNQGSKYALVVGSRP